MKTFTHNDCLYTRILPSPRLYNSNMIREVTNRGDIFALCLDTMTFTILPGKGRRSVLEMGIRKMPMATTQIQLVLDL